MAPSHRTTTLALRAALLALLCGLGSPAWAEQPLPEGATGYRTAPVVTARHYLAVTAHPLATQAAAGILQQGGSAIDAAIAAQMMLTLVEPQSSGIGGGGFLLYYDAKRRQVQAYDGRETAPAKARSERFLDAAGEPLPFSKAVASSKAVGVPGLLAMLGMAHAAHGTKPWRVLFQPAIDQARKGFAISPRLYRLMHDDPLLCRSPTAAPYFCKPDGTPRAEGSRLANPALAATLRQLARQGPAALYQGQLGRDIVATLGPEGDLDTTDLARYRAVQRPALCRPVLAYTVCGMPPPSSGGIAVIQMLSMLAPQNVGRYAPADTQFIHRFAEAGRLAYADRDHYVADPDFVAVPSEGLLDPGYLRKRAALISPERSMGHAAPGQPAGAAQQGQDSLSERPSTTHMVIRDARGDIVSMTSSIEDAFGNRRMVDGFLLNNQLTDFAFEPVEDGQPVANRVEDGKRPRSSMSPIIVLDTKGEPLLAIGSPGGSAIINYVAQTLVAVLWQRQTLAAAVALPHFGSRNGSTELETNRGLEAQVPLLRGMGHEIKLIDLNSGLHGMMRRGPVWESGVDPRREGSAQGQ